MVPILIWIIKKMFAPTSPHEELVLACLEQLDIFYTCLQNWSAENAFKAAQAGRYHVVLYSRLTEEALLERGFHDTGWSPYRFYPKHHLMVHLSERIPATGNPRDIWNYLDEDAIGDAVDAASTCNVSHVCRSLINKYRL